MEMSARARRYSEQLSALLPGWRYVDSDVRVDGEPVAELLGRIGDRMVFVHSLKGSKREVTGEVMVRLASAREDARRLSRLYRTEALASPLLVIVVEGKTRGLIRHLDSLCPDPVLPFAERHLKAVGRTEQFLEELVPAQRPPAAPESDADAPGPAPASVVGDEAPGAPSWEEVVARIDRIDSRLERREESGEARWVSEGFVLCSVSADREGQLFGRLGTDGVQHSLRTGRALEVFLDWVLAHLIEESESGDGEGLRDVELMPHPTEPLLTPEELAAFQE